MPMDGLRDWCFAICACRLPETIHPRKMYGRVCRDGIEVVALVEEFYPKPKIDQREQEARAKHVFKVVYRKLVCGLASCD